MTPVLILSTMRSGSTLIKALLGSAPDVSSLPETNFQRFQSEKDLAPYNRKVEEPILVFKRPAWLNEIKTYPKIPPLSGLKKIMLVRDAYPTVESVRKMMLRWFPFYFQRGGNKFLAEHYWERINDRLLRMAEEDRENSLLIRYEDVLSDPKGITKKMFEFVGSSMKEGIDRYKKPENYKWRWGKDDGGDKIKSLVVQKHAPVRYANRSLLNVLKQSGSIAHLREQLHYPSLPN